MRILVSLKIVPDLDLLQNKEWTIINNLPVETGYVKKVINTYDESALELALKMADHCKEKSLDIELIALTIGKPYAGLFLKRLLALGYHKTYLVNSNLDLQFNPDAVATIIASFAKLYGPLDLIVMGMQSSDGDNAKTALLVAEELAWPCITGVTGFNYQSSKQISVNNISDQGLVKQTVHAPCMLTIGNAPGSILRVPTLKEIKSAQAKEVNHLAPEELNCKAEDLVMQSSAEIQELEAIDNHREGKIIKEATVDEKARLIYNNYLKGWLNK